MSAIEFSKGQAGEVIDTTQILVASDLARLRALSKPDSGLVRVDYLLVPEIMGAAPHHVTNIATRDYGAAEYESILHEVAPARLEMTHSVDVKNKVD